MIELKNYKKYDPENLWIGIFKPKKINLGKPRYSTIYKDPEKLEDLIIEMPYAFIPFEITFWKTVEETSNPLAKRTLTLSLSPLIGLRNDFKFFIKNIEDTIKERLSKLLSKDYVFNHIIKFDPEFENHKHKITLGLPRKNGIDNFAVFKSNKEPATINDIKAYSRCQASIILAGAWVNDLKKEFGVNWNIYHITIFPQVSMDYISYNYLEDKSKTNVKMKELEKKKEILKFKCPECFHKIELTININITGSASSSNVQPVYRPHYIAPPPIIMSGIDNSIPAPPPLTPTETQEVRTGYAPNIEELQSALKKLKKTKKKS